MPNSGDALLRSGFTGVEGLGRAPRTGLPEGAGDAVWRVEEDRSDEYDSFFVRVTRDPVPLVESDPFRTLLIIRNVSSIALVLGKRSQVTSGTGFILPANTSLSDIKTTGPVWVGPADLTNSTTAMVSVWIERDDD